MLNYTALISIYDFCVIGVTPSNIEIKYVGI